MNKKWYKALVLPTLAAGLILAPVGNGASAVYAASTSAVQQEKEIGLIFNGEIMPLTTPIYKVNGATMAPLQELAEALEATVIAEAKTGIIIIRSDYTTISLEIGSKDALVNGKTVSMGAEADLRHDVVYVPIRFLAETLEATVEWNAEQHAVEVKTWDYVSDEEYEEWLEEQEELPQLEMLTPSDIVDRYDESVVMITTNNGLGSGIVIGEDLVLTNYHVIEDATSANVHTIYYDDVQVKGVVTWSQYSDLAIIQTEEPLDVTIVEISDDYYASKGDPVVAIGSPLGVQNTVSEGIISNMTYEYGVRYIQMNAPIDSGSSGGALFNAYGQLIGINSFAVMETSADLNFAISAYYAADLLDSMTEEELENAAFLPPSLPDSLAGASMKEIEDLLEAEFGTVMTSGGETELTKWKAEKDHEGWLVITAQMDPRFYMYYGVSTADEWRMWAIQLGHELHRMLPDDKIQVRIQFQRDYPFKPRGLASDEVKPNGDGKWRVQYDIIDMQLMDQMYMETRF
ncbi:trypsin-like peptidase domain-containing protein [Paenibacillus chungangensis]|uniref:Trypsin-like peptidase domain-containing protein n=1 Tax=Paenibacillus chungangensis TaxID=696535 RepID=A0ABW3HUU2_9BACL